MIREVPATRENLLLWLTRRPLLWVGAGLSVAAGYPSTDDLVQELCAEMAGGPDCRAREFTETVDLYRRQMGDQALAHFLNWKIGVTRQPVAMHLYIAALAGAAHIASIYTTNYDDLLERSLRNEGVHVTCQAGEENLGLSRSFPGEEHDSLLLSKVHGDGQSWMKAVFSGESYENYYRNHPWMREQITRALADHWVVFLGCSLQDPRLLSWLTDLPDKEATRLNPWLCFLTRDAWRRLETYSWHGTRATSILDRANITVALIEKHEDLPALWSQALHELVTDRPRRSFLSGEWTEITRLRQLTRVIIDLKPGPVAPWAVEVAQRDLIPRSVLKYWDYVSLSSRKPRLEIDTVPGNYAFNLREYTPPPPPGSKGFGASFPVTSNSVRFAAQPGTYFFAHTQTEEPRRILDIPFGKKRLLHLTFDRFVPWPLLIEAGDYSPESLRRIAADLGPGPSGSRP